MTIGTIPPNEKDPYKIVNLLLRLAEGWNKISDFTLSLFPLTTATAWKDALGIATGAAAISQLGRLTLTSGVDVTSSDVTGATSIYFTPSIGDFTELTNVSTDSATGKAGPAAVAANKCYFLMVWDDAGTTRLTRSPAWTSDTDPGTGAGTAEIERVGGVWVNKVDITNGPTAGNGYIVGGFRSNGSSQLVDSKLFRWVSNIYNQAPRSMKVIDATDSWTYSTFAWRQANNNAANQVDWFHALGSMVDLRLVATVSSDTALDNMLVGIGFDGANPSNANFVSGQQGQAATGSPRVSPSCCFTGYLGQGRHYGAWFELFGGSGTATWYGDSGTPFVQSGISGWTAN